MIRLSWRHLLLSGALISFVACAQADNGDGDNGEIEAGGEAGTSNDAGKGGSSDAGKGGSSDAGKGGSSDAGKGGSNDAGKGGSSDAGKGGSNDAGKGGNEVGGNSSGGAPPKVLDSALSLPPPSADACTNEGKTGGDCKSQYITCRIYSTEEGRCEGCSPCGKLGATCKASVECGLDSQCYAGVCREFCTLGAADTCKGGGKCKDVGNARAGVCVL